MYQLNKTNSPVLSADEMQEINELRKNFENLSERDQYLVIEALRPYFKNKK